MKQSLKTGAGAEKFASVLSKIIVALEIFSSVAILVMMLLTFVDVIGRYLFSEPIFGASEMISALLALIIFSGLGIINARDEHIVVELFNRPLRNLAPRLYEFVIQAFSIFAMGLVAFVLFQIAIETLQQNARTFVLEIPLFYVVGSVSFLAALSVVSQVMGVILALTSANTTESE